MENDPKTPKEQADTRQAFDLNRNKYLVMGFIIQVAAILYFSLIPEMRLLDYLVIIGLGLIGTKLSTREEPYKSIADSPFVQTLSFCLTFQLPIVR